MGRLLTACPRRLSRIQIDELSRAVVEAADQMTDDDILDLADQLHDALRKRRRLRGRSQERMEQRRCGRMADFRL